MAVGWKRLKDLNWVEAKKESRERLKLEFAEAYPGTRPTSVGRDCSQLIHFIADISEGDLVVAADGATVLGIGRVTGSYEYCPEFDFPHQRPVEWLSSDEWKMPEPEGLRSTVRELRKYPENLLEVERRTQGVGPLPRPDPISPRITRLTGLSGRIQSILDRKGQVILYGPPGTGKTFWADRTARDLAAMAAFGCSFDSLRQDSERALITGNGSSSGLVRLCCFHPAYGYEDFIEGYRPETINGQVHFQLRSGVFKRLCSDARQTPEHNFYLIIDEINRGDIPRIFGELLTTLEKDKREKPIVLPVSQEVFTVPKNVFLIGTMNTADRSISLLDAALRRRFGFVEMMPDGRVLKEAEVSGIPLRAWFDALNDRIRDHVGRDARNLQIGHSYLMHGGSPLKDMASLKRAIRDDVLPLLEEYCYEDYDTLEKILGEQLVDRKSQRIRHEHFDDGQEEVLKQALLAPCSDIMGSTEAVETEASRRDEQQEAEADEGDDADDLDEATGP